MSEQEFKVGDKVITVKTRHLGLFKEGLKTEITKACINSMGGNVRGVYIKDEEGHSVYAHLNEIIHYIDEPELNFKYPKVMILGYGRHGKDTVGEILGDFGYNITSSSFYAANKFIYTSLKDVCGYSSVQECFDDRHNKRTLWYELIKAYNKETPSRLAHEMLKDGFDVYVGLRDDVELQDVKDKGLYDLIVWVDATERLGFTESSDSCKVTAEMCDVVITNNGTLGELRNKVIELFELKEIENV